MHGTRRKNFRRSTDAPAKTSETVERALGRQSERYAPDCCRRVASLLRGLRDRDGLLLQELLAGLVGALLQLVLQLGLLGLELLGVEALALVDVLELGQREGHRERLVLRAQ